jgi:hypothetical protein
MAAGSGWPGLADDVRVSLLTGRAAAELAGEVPAGLAAADRRPAIADAR